MKKIARKRMIWITAFLLVLIVVVLILFRVLQNTGIISICSGSYAGEKPCIRENHVAWYDGYRDSLCLYDMRSRKTEVLSRIYFGRNFQFSIDPRVSFSNEWLLWIDPSSTVAGYKLDSVRMDPEIIPINHLIELQFPIVDSFSLSAGGDFVVWEDLRNGNKDIFGFNLKTRQELAICTDPGDQIDPDTDGNLVVWAQDTGSEGMNLFGHDLKTRKTFRICDQPDKRFKPKVSGQYVIWLEGGWPVVTIGGKDLQTGHELIIGQPDHCQEDPDISGSIVVWTDTRDGVQDIYGYELEADHQFAICTDQGDQSCPAIDGRTVVWYDQGRQSLWTKLIEADTSSIRGRILTDELIYGKKGKPSVRKPSDPEVKP